MLEEAESKWNDADPIFHTRKMICPIKSRTASRRFSINLYQQSSAFVLHALQINLKHEQQPTHSYCKAENSTIGHHVDEQHQGI